MIVIIQKQIELYAKKIVILIILFMKMILVEILNLLLEKFDCNTSIFKIYNPSDVEINLTEKSLFNEGFTKIQIILIVLILFPSLSSTDPEC